MDIDVSAEKPRNLVELRFEPNTPLDLAQVEAITLSAKSHTAGELKLRDIFLCNPGFEKIATVAPAKSVILKPDEDWHQTTFDLADARVLDKKLSSGRDGSYDRRDVATICINFLLPPGEVHGRLLLDGLKAIDVPPSSVVREALPGGGFKVKTPHYQVSIGSNGYVQSIRAAKFDFLQAALSASHSESTASAAFENNDAGNHLLELQDVRPEGWTGVIATGDKLTLRYVFREHDFDILVQQRATSSGLGLNLVLADGVVASLDGRTDRALDRRTLDEGQQISSRLMTDAGTGAIRQTARSGVRPCWPDAASQ